MIAQYDMKALQQPLIKQKASEYINQKVKILKEVNDIQGQMCEFINKEKKNSVYKMIFLQALQLRPL